MTDTAETGVQETPAAAPKSRRGRRIMAVILAALLLLLGLTGYLLFRLVATPGGSTQGDVDTGGLTWVRSIYGMTEKADDQLERAQAAVPGLDGAIWVIDSVHRSVMRFTPDGRFTNAVTGPTATPLDQPARFAIGPDGLFYVTEPMGDAVAVLDGNRDAGSFRIPKPVSVAVSEDRIVVGTMAGFAILDKQGKPLKVIGTRGQGDDQFDYVHGVAIGEDGKVYVVDSYNNRLSAYDRNGKRLWIVRTGRPANQAKVVDDSLATQDPGDVDYKGDSALQLPLGLTMDGAGRLVLVDMFDCSIVVVDPKDGSFIAKYGEVGSNDGQLFYPQSISYDSARDWFTVADSLNNRVQVVRLPDSSSTGGALAAARRGLAGPLRACLFPFLLIVLALITYAVVRTVRKRRENRESLQPTPEIEPSTSEE